MGSGGELTGHAIHPKGFCENRGEHGRGHGQGDWIGNVQWREKESGVRLGDSRESCREGFEWEVVGIFGVHRGESDETLHEGTVSAKRSTFKTEPRIEGERGRVSLEARVWTGRSGDDGADGLYGDGVEDSKVDQLGLLDLVTGEEPDVDLAKGGDIWGVLEVGRGEYERVRG